MRAYKAFSKDLSCTHGGNRFQYELNTWNEEPEANCVKNGFHCAENPLDCLTYYPDWDSSRFFEVEASGDIDEDARDSKISCTRMMLIRELDLKSFVVEAVKYIKKYPFRKYGCHNRKIKAVLNVGEAVEDGALIVRGRKPKATAAKGAFIALLREDKSGAIEKAVLFRGVEGQTYAMDEDGRIVRAEL